MNPFLLLAETTADGGADTARLIIEYVIYAAIIVAGLFILALLRRAGRLPKHAELKKQFSSLSDDLKAFARTAASLTRYQFFRRVTKLLYRAEKLEFTATQISDKERDGDIGTAAIRIQNARDLLAPYKFGKRDSADLGGISEAADKIDEAISIIDQILARDAELKARRAKKA